MPVVTVVGICTALLAAVLALQSRGAGELDRGSVPPERLIMEVVRAVPMSEAELDTVREQLKTIWRQAGLEVELMSSSSPSPGVRLLLTASEIRVSPASPNLCDLGMTPFVNGTPAPELTVSVTAARDFVRRARPEWSSGLRSLAAARIMGRVAAHELGHYLLGERGHRPLGLMRARFNGADLLGTHMQPFLPPPRRDIEKGLARLGISPSG